MTNVFSHVPVNGTGGQSLELRSPRPLSSTWARAGQSNLSRPFTPSQILRPRHRACALRSLLDPHASPTSECPALREKAERGGEKSSSTRGGPFGNFGIFRALNGKDFLKASPSIQQSPCYDTALHSQLHPPRKARDALLSFLLSPWAKRYARNPRKSLLFGSISRSHRFLNRVASISIAVRYRFWLLHVVRRRSH